MDLHSKIAMFLRDKKPETYCDDCIAEETASDVAEVRDETASMRKQQLGFCLAAAYARGAVTPNPTLRKP